MKVAILVSCVAIIFIISAVGQIFNKPKLVTISRVMTGTLLLGASILSIYIIKS